MNLFKDFFPNREPFRLFRSLERLAVKPAFDVAMQVYKREIWLEARLPGFQRHQIQVIPRSREVTIRIENREEVEVRDDRSKYYRRESKYGRMERTIVLPSPVDPRSARISFQDGILRIVLKKKKRHKIF